MLFNGLTEAEAERLAILSEECGEVIQVIGKILCHGYESTNPTKRDGETNRQMLEREMGCLHHALRRMTDARDLRQSEIYGHSEAKAARITPYLHHQNDPRTPVQATRRTPEELAEMTEAVRAWEGARGQEGE